MIQRKIKLSRQNKFPSKLITGKTQIWKELSAAAKACEKKSFVAVAYFSKNAAEMLPLPKGSVLVVDASHNTVKSGQTCPAELLKLYKIGVNIFSFTGLHAKVFVFDNHLYIGSANVSAHSANYLEEAVLSVIENSVIKDAVIFIKSLCVKELGPDALSELQKIYKAPKFFGPFAKGKSKRNRDADQPSVFVVKLRSLTRGYDRDSTDYKKGRSNAESVIQDEVRHIIEDYKHSIKAKPKIGDIVIRVTHDNGNITVAPPATILNIQSIQNTKRAYVFVEAPYVKDKKLNVVEYRLKTEELRRGGKKSAALAASLNALWI